jgi:hypothetical protein
MKKYLALLFVVTLFVAGCGKKEPAPSKPPANPPEKPATP